MLYTCILCHVLIDDVIIYFCIICCILVEYVIFSLIKFAEPQVVNNNPLSYERAKVSEQDFLS